MQWLIRVSYCMVCASAREDDPRALASGYLPYSLTHNTITFLLHQYAFAKCKCILVQLESYCEINIVNIRISINGAI